MAELPDTLADRQRAFAAHLRDPSNPAPPGIEARRMAVYRDLFYNAIEGLLAAQAGVTRWPVERVRVVPHRGRKLDQASFRAVASAVLERRQL